VIKSRRIRWAGYVAGTGEGTGIYRVLLRIPEGDRPLGRPRGRLEDNIKMDLQKWDWGGGWTGLICLRRRTGDEHF